MQDFIKQSSAHKRHQRCAILDHINIFQSRIIFQRRDKAHKNMRSRYQHKILNPPRRGAGGCLSTRASRGARVLVRAASKEDTSSVSAGPRAWLCVAARGCASGRPGLWRGVSCCGQVMGVLRRAGVKGRYELYLDK